jgi:hypothetical protein
VIIADTQRINFRTMPNDLPPERWQRLYRAYLVQHFTATGRLRIYATAVLIELLAIRAGREAEARS